MSQGHSSEVEAANQLDIVPQSDALIDGFTVPEVAYITYTDVLCFTVPEVAYTTYTDAPCFTVPDSEVAYTTCTEPPRFHTAVALAEWSAILAYPICRPDSVYRSSNNSRPYAVDHSSKHTDFICLNVQSTY